MEQPSYAELVQEFLKLQEEVVTLGKTCMSSITLLQEYKQSIDNCTITEQEILSMFSLMKELKEASLQFDHIISSTYVFPYIEKILPRMDIMSSSLAILYMSIEESLIEFEKYKKKKKRFSKEVLLKWIKK